MSAFNLVSVATILDKFENRNSFKVPIELGCAVQLNNMLDGYTHAMIIQRVIQSILSATAAASVLFFLGYEFFESSTRDIGAAVFMMFLAGAALSPILLWWILSFFIKSLLGRYVLSIFATAASAFGAFVYYDGLFVHVDALNALLFLFFPMYQDGALVLLFGVIYFFERRGHRHDPPNKSTEPTTT